MINEHEQKQLNNLLKTFNKSSKKKYKDDSNLKGKRSVFSSKMFEKYDIPARNIIKEKLGNFVIDNPDEFQQDLIITDKSCKYKYLELQVMCDFPVYPSDKLYVYERKAKYNNDTLFLTLNKNFTQGHLFDRQSLSPKSRRLQKYHREYVYDVPWNRVITLDISCIDPDTINMY